MQKKFGAVRMARGDDIRGVCRRDWR